MSSVTSCNNPLSLYIICNGFCCLQHDTLTDRGNLFGKSYWKNPYRLLKGSHFGFLPVSLFHSDSRHKGCGLYTFSPCGCHYLSFEFWDLILVTSSVRKECECLHPLEPLNSYPLCFLSLATIDSKAGPFAKSCR